LSSAVRLLLFAPLTVALTRSSSFTLEHVWELSVATILIQAVVRYVLLRAEFRRRLSVGGSGGAPIQYPA
jgi:hypothetical protein